MGSDAAGFFGGGRDPLIQRIADGAALRLLFDDDEADEKTSGCEARAQRILPRQHAIEDEGHVVGVVELGDGEHAAGVGGFRLRAFGFREFRDTAGAGNYTSISEVHDFFGQSEDSWLAGD